MTQIEILYKDGGTKLAVDYVKVRALILTEVNTKGGWGFLSDKEKDVVIDSFLEDPLLDTDTNNINKVTHLVTVHGMSSPDAQAYLAVAFATHHVKEVKSCEKRAASQDVAALMATYLDLADARDFIDTTKAMYDMFRLQGIKGTQYGTVGEGLLDFIESQAGTSFEFIGLAQQGYVLKTGVIQDLVTGLVDMLINGNYTK